MPVDFPRMIWPVSGALFDQDRSHASLLIVGNRTHADRDDRGKLNIAEFHVAMALIYRST